MLLQFSAKNYKSFRDEFIFSMIPAPKQKGLDYSVQKKQIGRKTYKALSSAVIYGANASGKTNIIGAIDAFRAIVLRGSIKNSVASGSPNTAAYALELIPNCALETAEPVEFSISFIEANLAFRYSLKMDLGLFLDQDHPRKILEETLHVNETCVFTRNDGLFIGDLSKLDTYLNTGISDDLVSASKIALNSLNDEELFLTNGFKSIFSKTLSAIITNWFDEKLIVIYRSDAMHIMRRYTNSKENTIYVEKTLTDAAKAFGISSNALGYRVTNDSGDAELYSIFDNAQYHTALPADTFESYGTIRFVNEFPLVMNALSNGATLIMDEFDASIHPMPLMNIINIFHNDDINKNHAQLIFNTHNPIFLTSDLFRRDEIKFVERDDTTNESTHYSLSDFKTYGSKGVRKGEDYMRNYFVSRYGAIKDVDFAPIMDELLRSAGEENG